MQLCTVCAEPVKWLRRVGVVAGGLGLGRKDAHTHSLQRMRSIIFTCIPLVRLVACEAHTHTLTHACCGHMQSETERVPVRAHVLYPCTRFRYITCECVLGNVRKRVRELAEYFIIAPCGRGRRRVLGVVPNDINIKRALTSLSLARVASTRRPYRKHVQLNES